MNDKHQYPGGGSIPAYPTQGATPGPPVGFMGPEYTSVGMGFVPGVPQAGFANQAYGLGPTVGPQMGFAFPPQESAEPKPYSNESGNPYGDLNGIDFSEKTIRMAFIRKVYGLLSVQLLMTTGLIALFTLHEGVKGWMRVNSWFPISTYVISLVLLISLACCEGARRKFPTNIIILGLFTLTYGTLIGVITSQYNVKSVVLAAGVTVVICVGLTIFAFQTKYDFTMMGGALFCCLLVFILFGFLAMFIRLPVMHMILAGVGAMLFSVFLVYDTQLMIGGNHKMSISPEEYVFAAINIYIDVIMIFLYLLRLFGSRD